MSPELLLPLLTKYGTSSISYSTLEPGLQHLVRPGVGYASYGTSLGHRFVLGRPVCKPEELSRFASWLVHELRRPAFVQIKEHLASILDSQFHYKITQIGVETLIPIQNYVLTDDRRKRRLRASLKKGEAEATVRELTARELQEDFRIGPSDLRDLSKAWLAKKPHKRHLKFLIRRTEYRDQPFVRKFYSIGKGGQLLGFAFFTPMFANDRIVGYCADTVRAHPSAPYGHGAFMVLSALGRFRAEGLEKLSLGLSPTVSDNHRFRTDRLTHVVLKHLYARGNSLFNFQGIAQYKRQFAADRVPVFVATRKTFAGFEALALARLMRFV